MRGLLSWLGFSACFVLALRGTMIGQTAGIEVGRPLVPWAPGELDIHQIAVGRGNSALLIAPDGTSVMIDAGASNDALDSSTETLPNPSRRPGEWIARYALRQLAATGRSDLDYLVVTHLHPDHIGDIGPRTPQSAKHPEYLLTGVTDVAEILPIGTLIDRGYPDYRNPPPWPVSGPANYLAFVAARRATGERNESARVGSTDQIRLLTDAGRYPGFGVRVLAANGVVWTGESNGTKSMVPPLQTLAVADYPDENMCSIALRVSYGKFVFYTGGDLHCDTRYGKQPWRDVETPATRACGQVDVAVADHHGYFDAVGVDSVTALQPRIWLVPAWHITHLNIAVLDRMLSPSLYAGPRDVFVTNLMPATALVDRRFLPQVASTEGHILIRVFAGGTKFLVVIIKNTDEANIVKAVYGPFSSGSR